jgi:hypothetical protein
VYEQTLFLANMLQDEFIVRSHIDSFATFEKHLNTLVQRGLITIE